jgi:hypothetical protein
LELWRPRVAWRRYGQVLLPLRLLRWLLLRQLLLLLLRLRLQLPFYFILSLRSFV